MRTDITIKKKGRKETKGVNYESHAPSLACFQQQAFRKHCTKKDRHMHIDVYVLLLNDSTIAFYASKINGYIRERDGEIEEGIW